MQWLWLNFNDLSVTQLYAILKLRQDVFILEQECLYSDIDDLDKHCTHLLGIDSHLSATRLAAYLRIIPASQHASGLTTLGRILTGADYRGQSLGKIMMQETMLYLKEHHAGEIVNMSAQSYLEKFYNDFGFSTVSDPYDDDGIMHIDMQARID